MSHFTCLVIGNDIEAQLQPFHEFECTGFVDQYVQNVDKLEEAREGYERATATLVVQRPDGTKVYAFTDKGDYIDELRVFLDESKRGLTLPDGYVELRDEPAKDWQSLAQWAAGYYGVNLLSQDAEADLDDEHKYGWARTNNDGELIEFIDRTNPNKQWDWWTVGGRWSGMLLLKNGERADSAAKGDIDFEGLRIQAEAKATEKYDRAQSAIQGRSVVTWPEMRERHTGNIDAARAAYHAQPAVQAFVNLGTEFGWGESAEDYTGDRAEFIAAAGRGALSTFAVLKDGTWYERGEMGWFGMASNETPQADWDTTFNELLADVPDDTVLTVVDCHI